MIIDVHAHILPQFFLNLVSMGGIPSVSLQALPNGGRRLLFDQTPHPCMPAFYEVRAQLANMDAHGIDRQAVSIGPRLFFYDRDSQWAAAFCHRCNAEILERCRLFPSRLIPVGGLPMQDAALALRELQWLASQNVPMIQIGTTIAGRRLDDPAFTPVFQAAAESGMVVMLHPLIENQDEQTRTHHLSNVAGNPYQTMAASGNLIAGGVLDQAPSLQVMLVHGGGALPYQIFRMDHAWEVRPKGEFLCREKPSAYLKRNFLSDALLFSPEPLYLLRQLLGDDRILYGTDAPYDMADYGQLDGIEDKEAARRIGCQNAIRWLRL